MWGVRDREAKGEETGSVVTVGFRGSKMVSFLFLVLWCAMVEEM